MPNPTTRTSNCFARGTLDSNPSFGGPTYVHAVYGPAWDTIPTAVDRSRLIAAAPALLEAARDFVQFFSEEDTIQGPKFDALRTAIRQATGGTQS